MQEPREEISDRRSESQRQRAKPVKGLSKLPPAATAYPEVK